MMANSLDELIKEKFGTQAKCAKAMCKSRQYLNKIVLGQREAKVTDINLLAETLDVPVSTIVNFLSWKSPNEQRVSWHNERSVWVMYKRLIQIEVDDAELEEIFKKINEAQRVIYNCYSRLQKLGIVKFKKPSSENDD